LETESLPGEFNLMRTGHLHVRDWNLIVSALQNLVTCCEESGVVVYGNLKERSHHLQKDIRNFILDEHD
jgi:hypothetical protein